MAMKNNYLVIYNLKPTVFWDICILFSLVHSPNRQDKGEGTMLLHTTQQVCYQTVVLYGSAHYFMFVCLMDTAANFTV